jgi:hypothetical protein
MKIAVLDFKAGADVGQSDMPTYSGQLKIGDEEFVEVMMYFFKS